MMWVNWSTRTGPAIPPRGGGRGQPRIGWAAAATVAALVVASCAPVETSYEVRVTNGCDRRIELVVTEPSGLADLDELALYATVYEPGQTIATSTVDGTHDVHVVAGVTERSPTVLATMEVSASTPSVAFTVTGDDCAAATI